MIIKGVKLTIEQQEAVKILRSKHAQDYAEWWPNRKNINEQNDQDMVEFWAKRRYEGLHRKVLCECGSQYTFQNKSQHFQTNKHKKYCLMKTLNEDQLIELEILEAERARVQMLTIASNKINVSCGCGGKYFPPRIIQHCQSLKHKEYLKNIDDKNKPGSNETQRDTINMEIVGMLDEEVFD